ncbi:MAG TPA: triose-phosphate isomerase [Leptospiraceae bacterium]|nr:triose-phosphate isomerase [Leptospiraceae bacterium]HMW05353.1 triose-phosphate isomerase [Leptospiraceae bacterium]HMX34507.1 triose-phosphate isomerase [Leptospiraceae bacterium]HMY31548.1 triose-phosphate isomerase [Leptospiraceae bacterium]HMZ66985.1 triose-phosphate isomerase [Leptospiraceae bacterium]
MRKKIMSGNWKMNLNLAQATELATGIKKGLESKKTSLDLLVFPSSIHLEKVSEILKGTSVKVGAQNIYPSGLAAFTGEISTDQLKDLGISHALVGHSERRQFLGETDSFLNQKILFLLKAGFTPVFCIGETLQEREANKTFDVVKRQVVEGLKSVSASDMKNIIIAYEPVWAIGTGKVATPEQAEEVHAFIRKELAALYDTTVSDSVSILYGGSVKPDNVKALLEKPNIDGGLVGGASQKWDSYLALL